MGRRKGSLNKSTIAKLATAAQPTLTAAPEHSAGDTAAATGPEARPFALMPASSPHIDPPDQRNPVPTTKAAFVLYAAPGGEKWRIEQGEELLRTFGISVDDLPDWHSAIAPQDKGWRLVRLRFGLAPLLAGPSDAEYLLPLSLEQIAEKLAMDVTAVHLEIDAVRAFWLRWKTANRSVASGLAAAPGINEVERATEAEREALLKFHGFSDITDPEEKLMAYSRIIDLKNKLEDEEGRTIARRAIRLELRLTRNDAIIAKLEHQAADPATDAEVATSLRNDIKGYHDLSKDIGAQHLNLMVKMNATQEQNPTVQRKVAFVDCIGQLIRGIQEYESRGDNTIIDGVFTAAEIKVQTRPMSLRPAQYRLDIVMITREAMKHENLWNPDYEPPAMERSMYRRMRKALRDALAAMEDDSGAVLEMEEEEGGGSDAVGEAPAPMGTTAAPMSGNGASQFAPMGTFPNRSGFGGPRVKPGDEFTTG